MEQKTVISIDHGYFQIKTPHHHFTSGVSESVATMNGSKNTLHYLGKSYEVGTKRKDFDEDKTKTEDYFLLTLAAIAKELETQGICCEQTVEITLLVGLPITRLNYDTKPFTDYLARNNEVLYFVYEGNEYKIRIANVQVYVQGFAAIVHEWYYGELDPDEAVLSVIDIGGWTTDTFMMVEKKAQTDTLDSLNVGMIKMLSMIQKEINLKTKTTIIQEKIECYLRGTTTVKPDIKNIIDEQCRKYAYSLLGQLKEKGIALENTQIALIGGGAILLKNYLLERLDKNETLVIEDVHANAKGYEDLYHAQQ